MLVPVLICQCIFFIIIIICYVYFKSTLFHFDNNQFLFLFFRVFASHWLLLSSSSTNKQPSCPTDQLHSHGDMCHGGQILSSLSISGDIQCVVRTFKNEQKKCDHLISNKANKQSQESGHIQSKSKDVSLPPLNETRLCPHINTEGQIYQKMCKK